MRAWLLCLVALPALVAGCGSSHNKNGVASTTAAQPPAPPPPPASTPLRATFLALTHRPRVNTPWRYVVGANPTDASGAPIQTELHVRVRVNGVWLDFGSNSFTGAYQDEISWPPSARGKLLVFEATVSAGGKSKTFRFRLRPK